MPNVPNTLSDGSAYSISVSYGFVKQFDKDFTAAPEVSGITWVTRR